MKIRVRYFGQIKNAAGVAEEEITLPESCSARALVMTLAERHGDPLKNHLLGSDGAPRPSVLLSVGDQMVRPNESAALKDGAVVTVLTPIAGG
jgi:molybdopterin converting factor small subunit